MRRLRVLVVTGRLEHRAGIELYTADLVRELRAQGHEPLVYTPNPGTVSDELRAEGAIVIDDLLVLDPAPDLIHGNSTVETIAALALFPGTPAVFVSHDLDYWDSQVPVHGGIRRYVGVSTANVRLIRETPGVDATRIRLVQNGVDLERFTPRGPLPPAPARAVYFSNYEATAGPVGQACERLGVELEVVGLGAGTGADRPELLLRDADLVFAKARCALEALAVGCAVVVCHEDRLGPLVTTQQYEGLRRQNFGYDALTAPVTVDGVIEQIKRYDATDAAWVRDVVRATASVTAVTEQLLEVYREAMQDEGSGALDPRWGAARLIELGRRARAAEQLDLRGARIGELEGALRHCEHDLAGLSKELADAVEDLASHRHHLGLARTAAEEARAGAEALQQELAALRAEHDALRAAHDALRATRTLRLRERLLEGRLTAAVARRLRHR